jgi:hypothetical protein
LPSWLTAVDQFPVAVRFTHAEIVKVPALLRTGPLVATCCPLVPAKIAAPPDH